MTTWLRGVNTDDSFYSNPTTKDRNFENFFTGKFRARVENIKYKFLPFRLYTNYKVYIKCQILYFLYLNQHKKFTISQITKPIINHIMKNSKLAKRREEVEISCRDAVKNLAGNFTILTEKYNKTKFYKYFFNPAYEQLFSSYDLFWNKSFIAEQLEKKQYFHLSRILKFGRILEFIGNKVVSAKQIRISNLFGEFSNFESRFLQPLIRLNLIKKSKKGRYNFYCLNN